MYFLVFCTFYSLMYYVGVLCRFLTFPALSMFGTTVGLYGIPWCKESLLLTVSMSVIGASMGILDTGKGARGLTVPSPD